MLEGSLIHPQILAALGGAGHGSRVLIADGNFPFGTGAAPDATRVYLNLSPGLVSVLDVLKALVSVIPVEGAAVMVPPAGPEPSIFADFRALLGPSIEIERLGRFEFYDTARGRDTALVIATGEQRVYANILLTIGVVPPQSVAALE